MKVLGIDVETTGLDTKNDFIIEVGCVVWDTDENVALKTYCDFIRPPAPITEEIKQITGIKEEWLQEYGQTLSQAMAQIDVIIRKFNLDIVVGHNLKNFDLPIIGSELKRNGLDEHPLNFMHVIDTRTDLPFKKEPKSRSLVTLCAEHGFLNPFPHRAEFDALATMKLMSFYDFGEVYDLSKIAWVTVKAETGYEQRQLAKDMRYSWEQAGDKTYPKSWIKQIRANQIDQERAACRAKGFEIIQLA